MKKIKFVIEQVWHPDPLHISDIQELTLFLNEKFTDCQSGVFKTLIENLYHNSLPACYRLTVYDMESKEPKILFTLD